MLAFRVTFICQAAQRDIRAQVHLGKKSYSYLDNGSLLFPLGTLSISLSIISFDRVFNVLLMPILLKM